MKHEPNVWREQNEQFRLYFKNFLYSYFEKEYFAVRIHWSNKKRHEKWKQRNLATLTWTFIASIDAIIASGSRHFQGRNRKRNEQAKVNTLLPWIERKKLWKFTLDLASPVSAFLLPLFSFTSSFFVHDKCSEYKRTSGRSLTQIIWSFFFFSCLFMFLTSSSSFHF